MTAYYVWHDEGCCDDKTDNLAEACRWADEFTAKGQGGYVEDGDRNIVYDPETRAKCEYCGDVASHAMPQSTDLGATLAWKLCCKHHADTWWEGADWDGRSLQYALKNGRA